MWILLIFLLTFFNGYEIIVYFMNQCLKKNIQSQNYTIFSSLLKGKRKSDSKHIMAHFVKYKCLCLCETKIKWQNFDSSLKKRQNSACVQYCMLIPGG